MPTLDEVVERIRETAGADFAFVLTVRGRLVTRDAPRDMAEMGRAKIVAAARGIAPASRVVEITMPREHLVRYGGAAPVDVFVAEAGREAIVAVVMSSWADKRPVLPAVAEGLEELERLLAAARPARGKPPSKRKLPTIPPVRMQMPPDAVEPAPMLASPPSPPRPVEVEKGKKRSMLAGLAEQPRAPRPPPVAVPEAPAITFAGAPPLGYARPGESMPEIVLGASPVGRETLAAVDAEARAAMAPGGGGGSIPDVRVELVSIGRQTEVDLMHEEADRMQSLAGAATPDPLVAIAAHRMTQPWVESPADAKRAADAARLGRRVAPPKVTVKLEEPDEDVLEAVLTDEEPTEVDPAPPDPSDPDDGRAPLSSLEIWHDAIADATGMKNPKPKAG